MSKKGGSTTTVQAPDPREVAGAEAEYNRINQVTPFGNLTFSGPNRNTATLEFTPEMQQLFNTRMGIDQSLASAGGERIGALDPNPINLDQFGPIQSTAGFSQYNPTGLPEIPTDMGAYRNNIEDAYFQRGRRLLDPTYQRQEEQLRQTLANQGLPSTGNAFLDQFDQFNTSRNSAYGNLANEAVMYGGQEASRLLADALASRGQLYNEGLTTTGFNNQLLQQDLMNANAGRVQGLNEATGIRGNQFNEMAALLGLQQVQAPQMSNFFAPGQVDILGANQLGLQANMFNAQQQNQMNSGKNSGLAGLGSAYITGASQYGWNPMNWSDRRLKKNIKRVGKVKGYPWYSFEYLWGQKSEGVMSDEIPQKFVVKDKDGFDMVDYHALLTG